MMRFRRTRPRTWRPKVLVDMQEYNMCRHALPIGSGATGWTCAAPMQEWSLITGPSTETTGTLQGFRMRGLSFRGARFVYKYTSVTVPSTAFIQTMFRLWSAIVVSPQNGGAPLPDPVTASLPVLGNKNGDLPNGVRILWRALDFLAINGGTTPTVVYPFNYNPLDTPSVQRIKAKAFLKEGMGLYFVTELVTGITDTTGISVALDLSMSLALRARG